MCVPVGGVGWCQGLCLKGLVMLFLGDRILSVNGQTVQHHQQASELIHSGPMVVSLLVEKADRDSPPDMGEGLEDRVMSIEAHLSGALSPVLLSHCAGELETSMDGAQLTGMLATSMMEQTILEEPNEGGHEGAPKPPSYTFLEATPLEAQGSPSPGDPQTVSVEWPPEVTHRAEEGAEEEEGEERHEKVKDKKKAGEEAEDEGKAGEEVDTSPVETVVTITRHPQKNTFGIMFEVSS